MSEKNHRDVLHPALPLTCIKAIRKLCVYDNPTLNPDPSNTATLAIVFLKIFEKKSKWRKKRISTTIVEVTYF